MYCVMEISSVRYGEVRIKGEGNQYEMMMHLMMLTGRFVARC